MFVCRFRRTTVYQTPGVTQSLVPAGLGGDRQLKRICESTSVFGLSCRSLAWIIPTWSISPAILAVIEVSACASDCCTTLQHLMERYFEGDRVLSKGTQGHSGGDLFLLEAYLSLREADLYCQPGHGLGQLIGSTIPRKGICVMCEIDIAQETRRKCKARLPV